MTHLATALGWLVFAGGVAALGMVAWGAMGMPFVPYVEGAWCTTAGAAHSFDIGMSRKAAFGALRSRYDYPGVVVSAEKNVPVPTGSGAGPGGMSPATQSPLGLHELAEVAVRYLGSMPATLEEADRWRISLPIAWRDTVSVEFVDDRVVEICRNRYLAERP